MNLLIYYWSEDPHSEKLKAIIRKVFQFEGHEVLECINITGISQADKGTGMHGQTMINAFKNEKLDKRKYGGIDLVEKALRFLSSNVMKYRYSEVLNSCDLQLFIVHMDGDLWDNSIINAESHVAQKIFYVAKGHKSGWIKSIWAFSQPKLKLLACVPVKEIETWLIQPLKKPATSGKQLDEIESAKEIVNSSLGYNAEISMEYKADPDKARLASELNIEELRSQSRSYQYFETSIDQTLSCQKGQLPEY